jgi:hypothetical protein
MGPDTRDDEEAVAPFRIQFTTGTVKPTRLPEFAYVSTRLFFDSIMYTAFVWDADVRGALIRIKDAWPDASPQYVQKGVQHFDQHDTQIHSVMFGAYDKKYTPFHWFGLRRLQK